MRKKHWDKIEELMKSNSINEKKLMGKYKIRDTFRIINRGIVFAGEITEGKISIGNWIRFKFKDELMERKIIGIEEIRTIEIKRSNTGLMIKCQNEEEIEQLGNWVPKEIDAEIFSKR